MNKILFSILLLLVGAYPITALNTRGTAYSEVTTVDEMYTHMGLDSLISLKVFQDAMQGYHRYHGSKPILAICDFSKPSSKERFFVVDLQQQKLIIKSLVAHGKNSGDLMATHFSNTPESLQSSLGFYHVGCSIQDPKHGLSLWLDGLEPGKNNNARMRGIIIHGADYVSTRFVKQYGYAGKSFGCPALPREVIPVVVPLLEDGALLYICKD